MSEPAEIVPSLLTLSGVVVGFGIKALSDWVQHKWDVQKRNEEKLEKRWERRSGFQRETLLELQVILSDMMRSLGAIHHKDMMAFKQGKKWHSELLGEEMNDENLRVMKRCNVLMVRVQDEEVRKLVKQMKNTAAGVVISMNLEMGDRALGESAVVWERVNERIGELLRKIDEEPIS